MSDRFSVYNALEERGFFAYSGEDGDLYRKHGLAGWRISVYPWSVRIQTKHTDSLRKWATVYEVRNEDSKRLTKEQKKRFMGKVDELVEQGGLPDEVSSGGRR